MRETAHRKIYSSIEYMHPLTTAFIVQIENFVRAYQHNVLPLRLDNTWIWKNINKFVNYID
jgi:hypothetical protein